MNTQWLNLLNRIVVFCYDRRVCKYLNIVFLCEVSLGQKYKSSNWRKWTMLNLPLTPYRMAELFVSYLCTLNWCRLFCSSSFLAILLAFFMPYFWCCMINSVFLFSSPFQEILSTEKFSVWLTEMHGPVLLLLMEAKENWQCLWRNLCSLQMIKHGYSFLLPFDLFIIFFSVIPYLPLWHLRAQR